MEEIKPQIHTRKDILTKMRRHIEPWLDEKDKADDINERTNLLTHLGMDSVGILYLVMDIEKDYSIKIHDYELDINVFSSVGNFIDVVSRKIHEAH